MILEPAASRQSPLVSSNFTKDLILFYIFFYTFFTDFLSRFFLGEFLGLSPCFIVFLGLVKTGTKIGDLQRISILGSYICFWHHHLIFLQIAGPSKQENSRSSYFLGMF